MVFPGVKRPGCCVDHPPPASAEVKGRVLPLPLWAFAACSAVEILTFAFSTAEPQNENHSLFADTQSEGRRFILCKQSYSFFIITNLIHKFLVHSHKLHKIKFLYMFRAQSAHHQEVNDVNCTYAASGIVTLCK
jgi:hypothetical protein